MGYKLVIELSERDLRHFRREMRRARDSVRIAEDEEIIRASRDLLSDFEEVELPDFVTERVAKVRLLLDMLEDADWPLAATERAPVLAGLAYLCDPEDIIPDSLPGIGLLDDAVMIELVFRELHHEIDAYATFVALRDQLADTEPKARAARLARRRDQLMQRMRRRRKSERKAAEESGLPPAALW